MLVGSQDCKGSHLRNCISLCAKPKALVPALAQMKPLLYQE